MTTAFPTDLAELTKLVASGKRPRYVFFWGHTPKGQGAVGAECFSQWYQASFMMDGIRYETAEHYMMAAKARLFDDGESEAKVLAAPSPGAAKAIGRKVRGFRDEVWTRERFNIVVRANMGKFSSNAALREYLQNTNDRILVEASPHDRIWGIGVAVSDARAKNPLTWRGLNLLGFALMAVRHRLGDLASPGHIES